MRAEAADKIRQFSLLDHRKDPGMVDAGIGSNQVRQKDACGLDLKDVVRHLPGRDTSLRRMYVSHGVPMEGQILMAKGVRQGCPASGFLFAMAFDPIFRGCIVPSFQLISRDRLHVLVLMTSRSLRHTSEC